MGKALLVASGYEPESESRMGRSLDRERAFVHSVNRLLSIIANRSLSGERLSINGQTPYILNEALASENQKLRKEEKMCGE